MRGIRLYRLEGPNHQSLQLGGARTPPEQRYWQEYLLGTYPRPASTHTDIAMPLLHDLHALRMTAQPLSSLDDLDSLKLASSFGELDYLYCPLGSTQDADELYIIPLAGLRLSDRLPPETVYGVIDTCRTRLQPDAHHLYFLANDIFLEADRVFATLPPFTARIEYDDARISAASHRLAGLCRQAH